MHVLQSPQGQSLGTHFLTLFLKLLRKFSDLMSFGVKFHSFALKFEINYVQLFTECNQDPLRSSYIIKGDKPASVLKISISKCSILRCFVTEIPLIRSSSNLEL